MDLFAISKLKLHCTNYLVTNIFLFYFTAAEVGILRQNLKAAMAGKSLPAKYDGYTSCPLVISPKECILAEFDFQAPPQPLETLPINQAKPRRLSYMMKSHLMPQLYWSMMLKWVIIQNFI